MSRCALLLLAWCLGGDLAAAAEKPARAGAAVARILQARAAKDSLFRHAPDSPLPAHRRASFRGLEYYPVDLRYRLSGALRRYGRPRVVQVPTTAGTGQAMERYGSLSGQLLGRQIELEVFRSMENGELLVLFTDQTSGRTTYAGGRYVPLGEPEDGRCLVDFNMAYNPYCAYNSDFVCPLPPARNSLAVPIEAGERVPPAGVAH